MSDLKDRIHRLKCRISALKNHVEKVKHTPGSKYGQWIHIKREYQAEELELARLYLELEEEKS